MARETARQPLLPGRDTLGVVGGGQLGRMFVHAAQRIGFRVAVLDPDAAGPAGAVAEACVAAAYDDPAGLDAFAAAVAAATTEFENVPAESMDRLAAQVSVAPAGNALAVSQDRAREKAAFAACGISPAPHAVIASSADVDAVDAALLPGILKTASLGYDGKGQIRVATREELAAAFAELGEPRCVLEQRLELDYEVSLLVARGADGAMVTLPLQENVHVDGILATTTVPAPSATPQVEAAAREAARTLAQSMGYVGVLCVEFFVLADGSVVANEMAPRPHNSGHYSIEACDVSQFELQVRTLAGLPLTEPRLVQPAIMLNLLGDLWFAGGGDEPVDPDWAAVLALPGTHLHLYGKAQARRARKMGHLTVTGATPGAVRETATRAAELLGLAIPGLTED